MSNDAEVPELGTLLQLSNEMGRVYKEHFGRGPTRVRTEFATADVILAVLENSFTTAERALVAMGEHERLRDNRTFLQYATVAEFCTPVERITGRTVRAFISGVDTVEDVSIETFVLHPKGSSAPSRMVRG